MVYKLNINKAVSKKKRRKGACYLFNIVLLEYKKNEGNKGRKGGKEGRR